MPLATSGLVLPARFNGPPGSANGGYACGRFAAAAAPHLGPPGTRAAVTLLSPPPLDTPLELRPGPRRSRIVHPGAGGGTTVATVTRAPAEPDDVPPVSVAVARAASGGFAGADRHVFPTCYACGTQRPDGLRLAPGPVPGKPGTAACLWVPDGPEGTPVADETVWAALDCPGGWTGATTAEPMVLSRMTAVVPGPVLCGRTHVVVAALRRAHGRTVTVGTALHTESGELLAKASAVWVAVPDGLPSTTNPRDTP